MNPISELIHELEIRLPDGVKLLDCNGVEIVIGDPKNGTWVSYNEEKPPRFAVIKSVIAVKLPS
jgi:hypothetical protein